MSISTFLRIYKFFETPLYTKKNWRKLSCRIWRRVLRWKLTDISEEHIATFFHAGILLGILDYEDGGGKFLRNVGWFSTDYTALYPLS
jgi:hypothetical protein